LFLVILPSTAAPFRLKVQSVFRICFYNPEMHSSLQVRRQRDGPKFELCFFKVQHTCRYQSVHRLVCHSRIETEIHSSDAEHGTKNQVMTVSKSTCWH
jgi:hypothetical protein